MHNFFIKYVWFSNLKPQISSCMYDNKITHLWGMCNKHLNETCDCIPMLCSIALSMAWKSWQRGHLGLPVDLHTQGTRALSFSSFPLHHSLLHNYYSLNNFPSERICSVASPLLGKRGTPNCPAQAHARRILGKGSMRPYFALFFCQLLSDSSARCLPFKSDLQPKGEAN